MTLALVGVQITVVELGVMSQKITSKVRLEMSTRQSLEGAWSKSRIFKSLVLQKNLGNFGHDRRAAQKTSNSNRGMPATQPENGWRSWQQFFFCKNFQSRV